MSNISGEQLDSILIFTSWPVKQFLHNNYPVSLSEFTDKYLEAITKYKFENTQCEIYVWLDIVNKDYELSINEIPVNLAQKVKNYIGLLIYNTHMTYKILNSKYNYPELQTDPKLSSMYTDDNNEVRLGIRIEKIMK